MAQTSAERKLTAKGAQTRELIVAAAARLVFDRGVAGTSLEDVRNVAGVSNSQLYHYFRDKSELVRAVVRHQADAVYVADALELKELTTLAELRVWRDAIVQSQRRRGGTGGCPLGSLVGELADTDEGAQQQLAAGFRRWQEAFAVGLSRLRQDGVLRPEADPQALAVVLLAALQGGLVLAQSHRDVEPLAVALDGAIDYVNTFAGLDG